MVSEITYDESSLRKRTKQPTCFYGPGQSGDDKTEVAAAAVERDRWRHDVMMVAQWSLGGQSVVIVLTAVSSVWTATHYCDSSSSGRTVALRCRLAAATASQQGCSGKFWFGGTVSESWVPATGELAPPRTACSHAGGACGRGSSPSAEEVRGVTPGNFLWDFWCRIPRLGAIWARK